MTDISRQQYSIDLWFTGKPEPVTFLVSDETLGRFQGDFQNDRNSYFVCDTITDTCVAINLRHVVMAHLSEIACQVPPKAPESNAWLEVYLLNHFPGIINIDDLECLGRIFVQLESAVTVPQEVIPINMGPYRALMIDPAAVMYLKAPSGAVKEGKKILYRNEQSGR
ncbi:MAG: hypothetical protein ACOX44_16940 [Limnochordia bacterium]